jgi:hypothetical protein
MKPMLVIPYAVFQLIIIIIIIIIMWRIRRYFRNERCYSTVGYGLGVSYATIFPNTRGQRKINPLLHNVYRQNAYFRGSGYIDKPLFKKLPGQRTRNVTETELVEFPTLANAASKTKRTLGQGVLSPVRKIYLRG